jgi:hypothetical protein
VNWDYALTNDFHESTMIVFVGLKSHTDSEGKKFAITS